jgi:iron complex outermembrane receptor protein
VIVSGPLRGIQFVGPNGTPQPFNFGTQAGLLQYGGDQDYATSSQRNLTNALSYGSAFIHARYDLNDNITAYVEGSYGKSIVRTDSLFYERSANLTIQADNAFLDPAIRQQLAAKGQTSFVMSRTFADQDPPGSRNVRTLWRGVVGLDGSFGKDFKWHVYYQHGQVQIETVTSNNPLVNRLLSASDAVRDPGSGAIVCRSTLTSPGNGCVPFNVFGQGAPSQQSIDYVFGTNPFQLTKLNQDYASADISGSIFHLPAGDLSIAAGVDAERESAVSTADPGSVAKLYYTGNFQPFDGRVTFKEAFGETNIPLIRNTPLLQMLELNAAARVTDYSTSGTVVTWKIGVSDQVTDDLRVRFTRSKDIRAPSLTNLFTQGSTGTQTVIDPLTNKQYIFLANTRGNPALKPEDADTLTAGIVYRPSWFKGFGVSLDYYNIKVKGAIASLTSLQTVAGCFGGQPELCNLIYRDANNAITQIDLIPTNINLLATDGFDLEMNYTHHLFAGTLTARALGSYQGKLDEVQTGGIVLHHAGVIAEDFAGTPKFKGLMSATYDQGPTSFTTQVRVVGAAKLRYEWTSGIQVDNNRVPAIAYLDLRASREVAIGGIHTQFTLAVDNVLNSSPPIVPATPGTIPYGIVTPDTRLDLYDAIGRSFRVNLRFRF